MVEDIESLLPEPSGECAIEVALYNAFRILGAAQAHSEDLQILQLACAHVGNPLEVRKMRASFGTEMRNLLWVFARVQRRGEEDEVKLLAALLEERLRDVLQRGASKGQKRNTARAKQKRRRRAS